MESEMDTVLRLARFWAKSGITLAQAQRLQGALERGEPMLVDGGAVRRSAGGPRIL